MKFHLNDSSGEAVGMTLSNPTVASMQTESLLKWSDSKDIALNNIENVDELHFTLQTEQKGITEGLPIATGKIKISEI